MEYSSYNASALINSQIVSKGKLGMQEEGCNSLLVLQFQESIRV